jgi:hypothetical protein
MKRTIIVVFAAVAAIAVPAQASASTVPLAHVTAIVRKGYSVQIRARARLAGFEFVGTTVKCAVIGHDLWTCYGTYTLGQKGTFFKYGQYISVTANGWKAQGNGTLIKEW